MKLINPSVELIQQAPSLVGMYKHIERCARTCYKSEDTITDSSYKKLCDKLGHNIHIDSVEGEYTKVIIEFGKNEIYKF